MSEEMFTEAMANLFLASVQSGLHCFLRVVGTSVQKMRAEMIWM